MCVCVLVQEIYISPYSTWFFLWNKEAEINTNLTTLTLIEKEVKVWRKR